MKTRAELDQEIRTMPFVVERPPCGLRGVPKAKAKFPFLIEVFVPAIKRTDYPGCDAPAVFRVTPKGRGMAAKYVNEAGERSCVCPHMGHLVE